MIIKSKYDKECFKREVGLAMINTSSCMAFVAMQDTKQKNNSKMINKLDKFYVELDNLWNYVDLCIDNDLNIDISNYSYNLVKTLSDVNVKEFKTFYRTYGEYHFFYE